MSSTWNPEEIDRRSFVRRMFAIGAGIAVGGELIRQVERLAPAKDAYEGILNYYGEITVSRTPTIPGEILFSSQEVAQRFTAYVMRELGGTDAFRAAMKDEMLYGGHGKILVGKDLRVRYEPTPFEARRNLVHDAWGKRLLGDPSRG